MTRSTSKVKFRLEQKSISVIVEKTVREREGARIHFFYYNQNIYLFLFFISYLTNKRKGKTTLFFESKNFVLRSLDCNFKFNFFFTTVF